MNLLLILIVMAFAYFMWQKNKGKGWKYVLGISLVLVGLLFIEFFPDPISLGAYAMFNNIDVSTIDSTNLANHLWGFEIWSITVGIVFLFSGAYLLGWDWKKIWKKINIDRYWIGFILAVLIVVLIAYIDIQGMIYWSSFSSVEAYTQGLQGCDFWLFFKSIVMVIFIILPISYFFLYRRDKSEAISLFLSEWIIWMFGLSDLMYFVLQNKSLPNILPWLSSHPVIGNVSRLLGHEIVTSVSLLLSVSIGFVLAYFTAKTLKERF